MNERQSHGRRAWHDVTLTSLQRVLSFAPMRTSWLAPAFVLAFLSACARDHAAASPATLTAATTTPTGGRSGAADSTGTRIGATTKNPIIVPPDELTWGEPPPMMAQGAEVAVVEGNPSTPNVLYTVRAKLPPNYRFMPHWHPTDEHVTVLSGALLVGHGDTFARDRMTELPAGGFAVLPAGHHHFAAAGNSETIIQIHGVGPLEFIYVDPADDPRLETAKPKPGQR